MKKGITILAAAVFYLVLLSNSGGGPAASTGAPNEQTCGRSGCHGVATNTGSAVLSLDIAGMTESYEAGTTYNLSVKLEDTQTDKNGFQIVALDADNNNAGTWVITDTEATRERSNSTTGRSYITHTSNGNRQGSWMIDWTAPSEDMGDITFYISALDTNESGSKTGDDLYTTSSSLSFAAVSGLSTLSTGRLDVYPSPASDWITLENLPQDVTEIRVYDLAGKLVKQTSSFGNRLEVQELRAGLYFLQVQTKERVLTQQFLVQR